MKNIFGTVLSLGFLVSPLFASAAGLTSSQISAIIQLLQSFGADQSVINNVQASLNGGTPTSNGASFCYNFNNDLTVGNSGADVSALNQALTSSGIDTTGNTSNFSENTAGDVVSFQAKYGIRQTGYVGPITRAKVNALYGCRGDQQPIQSVQMTGSFFLSVSPTSIVRNQTYIFSGSISNATPNSLIYFTLQRPDGSLYYDTFPTSYSTDANGNATISRTATIGNSGQNGHWTAWVTVDGKTSEKTYIDVTAPITAPAITVLSPNGGETLSVGQQTTIRWSSSNLSGNVSVYLNSSDGGDCLLNTVPVSQGYLTMGLSNYQCPNIPRTITAGQYKVLLNTDTNPNNNVLGVNDSSDNYFTVNVATPVPIITLFTNKDPNPTTGAVTIVWQTSSPARVALDMSCTPGSISLTINNGSKLNCDKGGAWNWDDLSSGSILITPSGNTNSVTVPFTLTVLDANGNYTNQKQTLNIMFPVVGSTQTPTITVLSPNGGETLTIGSVAPVTWTSANVDKVSLGYSTGPGSLNWIAYNIPNTGSYDWMVNVGNTTNTQYKIEIIGYKTGAGSVTDYSDNYFTIPTAH
ncbi:MAG: peptidoglycan-binding domain-containing protein [Minisyncoccota bacterium]